MYINFDISLKYRIALSKFEIYIHKLNVETGRNSYVHVAYEQRSCIMYNMRKIEDGFHFVMRCPVSCI